MGVRLVLDQGIPRDAAAALRDLGYECLHVGEAGMSKAADDEILVWAGQDSVVVTLDADFHTILACEGTFRHSIANGGAAGSGSRRSNPKSFRRIRNGFEALLSRNGEGAQDHLPPAADLR